jgi:hypothetical protein
VQVPTATSVTVAPETEQVPAVVLENVTVRPESEVALTVTGDSSIRLPASAPKVIVWLACAMANVTGTSDAAFQLASPAWEAVIVQLPAVTMVTVTPATVQTPVVLLA